MACKPQQQSAAASADREADCSVPPAKRRKITLETLLPDIESHVNSCEKKKITAIELLKITMLQDACRENDCFYVALHEMFSLWTSRPLLVAMSLEQNETDLVAAFSIIGRLINEDTTISENHAKFFSNFPSHISKSDQYRSTLISVGKFLLKLPVEWPKYRFECVQKRFPPSVVDEVGKRFNFVSVIFQRVIFTAIRKDMGFPEIGEGYQMDQIFLCHTTNLPTEEIKPRNQLEPASARACPAPPSVEIAVGASRPTDAEVWNCLCSSDHIIIGKINQKVRPAFDEILKQKWSAQSFEDSHLDRFIAIWLNPAYKEFATKLASGPAAEKQKWYVLLNDAADWLKTVFKESSSLISPVDSRSILRGLAQSTDDYKIELNKLFWDGGESYKLSNRREFLSYLTFTEYSEAYTTMMMDLPDPAWNLQRVMDEIRIYGKLAKKVMLHVVSWYDPNIKQVPPRTPNKEPIYHHLRKTFQTSQDWKLTALNVESFVVDFIKANKLPVGASKLYQSSKEYHLRFNDGSFWNLLAREIRRTTPNILFRHRDLLSYNGTSDNIHHSGRRGHGRNLGSNTSPIQEISAGISTNNPSNILSETHRSATAHPTAPQTSNMVLVEVPEPASSVKCGCAEAIRPNSKLIPIPLLICACPTAYLVNARTTAINGHRERNSNNSSPAAGSKPLLKRRKSIGKESWGIEYCSSSNSSK
ncbi:hypothetical protein ACLOAV_008325 [Pseudogymnoascus australis]